MISLNKEILLVSSGKANKLIRKIINCPRNTDFREIETILKYFGYEKRKKNGSHNVFHKKGERHIITVPDNKRPVKECYVKEVIKLLGLEDHYE